MTNYNQATNEIIRILSNEYGVGVAVAPAEAVIWAAGQCPNPRASLRGANRIRERNGMPLAHAPYGDAAY